MDDWDDCCGISRVKKRKAPRRSKGMRTVLFMPLWKIYSALAFGPSAECRMPCLFALPIAASILTCHGTLKALLSMVFIMNHHRSGVCVFEVKVYRRVYRRTERTGRSWWIMNLHLSPLRPTATVYSIPCRAISNANCNVKRVRNK